MSDFDKEAERERLREKYEREQEKRKSTERMSELLLKGATMTDAHCGNCGDPIFRYDGEEFCPTCQERVAPADEGDDAADGEGAPADADRDGATESAETAAGSEEPATPDVEERLDDSTQGDANGTGAAATSDATPSGPDADAAPNAAASQGDASAPTQRSQTPSPARSRSQSESSQSRSSPEPAGDVGADVGAARASLTRTLLTQARKAENCEDPRRAKDHLAAAREAAEALAALSY